MITLRPSASHMWTRCPSQPRMAANCPEEEPGDPAKEGTCAAWVAELILTGALTDKNGNPCVTADAEGLVHENGWVVDKMMVQYVDRYVQFMRKFGDRVVAEQFVKLTDDIQGTPDSFAMPSMSRSRPTLHVYDLKFGYDIVEPFQNTQISIYAEAICRGMPEPPELIVVGVVQPRAWHPRGTVRKWVVSRQELYDFAEWIIARGELTKDPTAPAIPGNHCKHCPAQLTCAAAAQMNYGNYTKAAAYDDQRPMSVEEMDVEMEFLESAKTLITARHSALSKEMETRIATGQHIPGWVIEERRGNRAFKTNADAIEAMTGIDARPKGVVTPAELERRGANIDLVAALSHNPRIPGKLKKVGMHYYADMFQGKDNT